LYNFCFEKAFAAWRGATGLSVPSPANTQVQRTSGFPLLSLAEVAHRMNRTSYFESFPMPDKKYYSLIIFLIASAVEVALSIFYWQALHIFVKPLIMLGLIGHYVVMSPRRSSLFISALAFCWMGDVLLLFEKMNPIFFVAGLTSFLAGHVVYLFCYRQLRHSTYTKELLGSQKARFSFPLILMATGLVAILYPSLGVLKIPIMMYALAITLMAMNALFRFGRTGTKSFVFVLVGAVLFMVSDCVLAINKFKGAIEGAGAIIMLTYCAAQFFIVEGALLHEKEKPD
jgi:uncharacterized membrane protein YhhN